MKIKGQVKYGYVIKFELLVKLFPIFDSPLDFFSPHQNFSFTPIPQTPTLHFIPNAFLFQLNTST